MGANSGRGHHRERDREMRGIEIKRAERAELRSKRSMRSIPRAADWGNFRTLYARVPNRWPAYETKHQPTGDACVSACILWRARPRHLRMAKKGKFTAEQSAQVAAAVQAVPEHTWKRWVRVAARVSGGF